MKLNNVRLLVNKFDECFNFYSVVLGLKVSWGKPGEVYASFDIGMPMGLSIFKSDLMAEAVGNSDLAFPENMRDKVVICISVENVDQIYKEVKERGGDFINEPTDMTGWGIRTVHMRDPEGNLLEIQSELSKEKWDKDLLENAEEYN